MRQTGWQGASLVAITYVYFLIFAQFAFLKRLADLGVAGTHLEAVMAAMAMGGILFSLLAPRLRRWPRRICGCAWDSSLQAQRRFFRCFHSRSRARCRLRF